MGETPPGREEEPIGAAPQILGRDRIKAGIAANLFGDEITGHEATTGASEASLDTMAADGSIAGGTAEIPEQVGRFRILDRLGRGGMGVVYSAHDPELDRKVAIKLLRPDLRTGSGGEAGPTRLLREAQAMARLTHPNVITVHEVGTVGERVFVAMEFVEGGTLKDWMNKRRPWREVVRVFSQAAAGLAAAHRADLVHRDFKPENVLMSADAGVLRARVVDFGLARSVGERAVEAPETEDGETPKDRDLLTSPLTQTGAVMGTPAYMSPEQHLGRPANERSDQFSFCVALWEALFGQRPFAGRTYPQLADAVVHGRRRSVPADARVPGFLTAALIKGLATAPEDRHASMDALIEILGHDPSRRWKRISLAVAVAVIASGATWALAGGSPEGACEKVGAELDGVWGVERRAGLESAFAQLDAAYGSPLWRTTSRILDDYATDWRRTSSEVCAAELVALEADRPGYERRRLCLDSRISELDQLVETLMAGDKTVLLQSVAGAAGLSEIAHCNDELRLAAWRAPSDAEAQHNQDQARRKLGAVRAYGVLGRYDEAGVAAADVVELARSLDDPALEAAALLELGFSKVRGGEPAKAEEILRQAESRAQVANAHGTRVEALARLVYVVGRDDERYEEARALGDEARGVLKVIGADPLLTWRLENNMGIAARFGRDADLALEHGQRALELSLELFGERHPSTASSYTSLGITQRELGQYEEAEATLRTAIEIYGEVLGPDHPDVAAIHSNLGISLGAQDRWDEALDSQRRAVAIRNRAFGEDHPLAIRSMFNLGRACMDAGRYEEAIEHFSAGLGRKQAAADPADAPPILWWNMLGLSHQLLGDQPRAIEYLQLSLGALEGDPRGATRANLRYALGRSQTVSDRVAGRASTQAAIADLEAYVRKHGTRRRDERAMARMLGWVAFIDSLESIPRH